MLEFVSTFSNNALFIQGKTPPNMGGTKVLLKEPTNKNRMTQLNYINQDINKT